MEAMLFVKNSRLAVLLVLALCLTASADTVSFAPSESGDLSAWHVTGPYVERLEPDVFSREGLPTFKGDAEPASTTPPIEWEFTADFPRDLIQKPNWDNAGFHYLYTCLTGPKKKCILKLVHRAPIRVWVDGKLTSTSKDRQRWYVYASLAVDLGPEPVGILIEMRGGSFAAYAQDSEVRQTTPGTHSPILARAVAGSVSVGTASRGVTPRRPIDVTVKTVGSRAAYGGPMGLTVRLCREDGKKIDEKTIRSVTTEDLANGESVVLATNEAHPFYKVEAEVTVLGKKATSAPSWTFNMSKAHGRAQAVADFSGSLAPTSTHKAILELRTEKLARIFESYIYRPSFCRRLREELALAEGSIEAAGGGTETTPRRGLLERAYISEVDGSPQPYIVYVPKSYDPPKPLPLILFLHGYAPALDKIDWDMMPASLFNLAERKGCLVAAPFSRGNTDFQGIGEDDVLNVLALVRRNFAVDPQRVFLAGISMGGSGVWTIAAHYPHLFAGAIPVSGRNDYFFWNRGKQIAPYADLFTKGDFAFDLAENFRNLPVLVMHGGEDTLCEVEQSRGIVKKLKELGFDVTYHELPKADHWVWEEVFASKELESWLEGKKLNPAPAHVTYRTYSTKYRTAYWVDVTRIDRWGTAARVDAKLALENKITLKTENTAAVSVWNGAVFKPGDKVQAELNGKNVTLEHTPGIGARLDGTEPPKGFPGEKRAGMCGPFREVFSAPFRIVFGRNDEQGKIAAETFAGQWKRFSQGRANIVSDETVDEKTMKTYNLVLVGSEDTNSVIKKVAHQLPFIMKGDSVFVAGRTLKGANLGFIGIYPNPLAPKKYLGFIWGKVWGAHLPSNHTWDQVPDFAVFYESPPKPVASTLVPTRPTARVLVAGYFDSRWKLTNASTWHLDKIVVEEEENE